MPFADAAADARVSVAKCKIGDSIGHGDGVGNNGNISTSGSDSSDDGTSGRGLVLDDSQAVGAVEWGVLMAYLRAMGYLAPVAVVLGAGFYAANAGSDRYLASWLAHLANERIVQAAYGQHDSNGTNNGINATAADAAVGAGMGGGAGGGGAGALGLPPLIVYILMAALSLSCVLVSGMAFAEGGVRASRTLHTLCLGRLLHAPVAWFQRTPSGRIVSRFSSDLAVVDTKVSFLVDCIAQLVLIIASSSYATLGTRVFCFSFQKCQLQSCKCTR
jgi:ABC-type multidrug transport system fused ATPase/permease subunit